MTDSEQSSRFPDIEIYPTLDPATIPDEVALSHINGIETLLQEKRSIIASACALEFEYPPSPLSTRPVEKDPQPDLNFRVYSPGPYGLLNDGQFTSQLLLYERWLLQSAKTVEWYGRGVRQSRFRYKRTIVWRGLSSAFGDLDAYKDAEWERQADEARAEREKGRYPSRIGTVGLPVSWGGRNSSHHTGQPLTDMEPAAAVSLLIVVVLHLLCGLSIDRCSFALVAVCSALELATIFCAPSDRDLDPKVISSKMQSDARTKVLTFYRDQPSEIWVSFVSPTSLPSSVRREDELPRIFLRMESM